MKKIKSRFIVSFLTVMTCVVASLSAEEKSADEIVMELGNPASCLTSSGNNIEYRTSNESLPGAKDFHHPYSDLNVRLSEIHWDTKPAPLIKLKAIDLEACIQFNHKVALDSSQYQNGVNNKKPTICTEPRPQICTQEYRPVCAQLQNGSFKTYSTGCTACTDSRVNAYLDGACE